LAIAVILAFDVVALFNRALLQRAIRMLAPDARNVAPRRFTSTEVADRSLSPNG
jgi:hypothetical protein